MNGHFQMPPNAFKIFIFLLLRVNHTRTQDCDAGEGWIDYEEIRRYCSEKGRGRMSNATISAALDYLERRGYIRRYREKNGLAQKIRVVNYRKYQVAQGFERTTCSVSKQGATSSVSKQVGNPCGTSDSGATCLETEQLQHETKQKQEYIAAVEEGEAADEAWKEEARLVKWVQWYEEHFALFPPRRDYEDMELLRQRGVTDDLIIAVLEDALANERIDRPLLWAKRRISDLLPRGIKTAEDYRRRKQMLEEKRATQSKMAPPQQPTEPEDDEVMRYLKEVLREQQRETELQ